MPPLNDFIKSKAGRICLLGGVTLGFLLMVILVPLSLSRIEYYEYGLKYRKTTGYVHTDEVYRQGRYLLGPTYNFLKYQADAHFEEFEALSVFSSGTSNSSIGLEFKIDVYVSYLLIPKQIGQLHRELAGSYRAVIAARTKDAIKNEAIFVSFEEYFQNRSSVERRFRQAVVDRWEVPPSVHATLDQFHLGRIRIPDSVAEKQLESRIQNERNDQEAYFQQAQRERDLTAVEVHRIQLEQGKVLRTANAEASLLRAKAEAQASQIKQEAGINGTSLLFRDTGITSQEDKSTYMYIRALLRHDQLDLDLSYLPAEKVVPTTEAA